MIGGYITEWIHVNVGVLQRCNMSSILFNVMLDYVKKEIHSLDNNFSMSADMSIEIRYADDTTLISTIFDKLKTLKTELEQSCKNGASKINSSKCALLSPENDAEIVVDSNNVTKVKEFTFLGSVVPDCESDVQRRISLASQVFGRLRKTIWTSRNISRRLKIRLYSALTLPIAIHDSEAWTTREKEENDLLVFEMKCLRTILGATRRERLRNDDIRLRLGLTKTIRDIVVAQRLRWFGHVVRSDNETGINVAYKQDFTGARRRGRPPKRWCDNIREDCALPLLTIERRARDRCPWRRDVVRWGAREPGVLR